MIRTIKALHDAYRETNNLLDLLDFVVNNTQLDTVVIEF